MKILAARALLVLIALVALSGCQDPPPELIDIGQLPAFEFVDQRGAAVGTEALRGRPWVASFIFTSCPTSCPPLVRAKADLQAMIKTWAPGPDFPVQLVSISVDPVTDTPDRLKSFGDEYGVDPNLWRLARGDYAQMEALVTEGFMLPIIRKDAAGAATLEDRKAALERPTPIDTAHSLRFVLVDGQGHIRGLFDKSEEDLVKLNAALKHLAGR